MRDSFLFLLRAMHIYVYLTRIPRCPSQSYFLVNPSGSYQGFSNGPRTPTDPFFNFANFCSETSNRLSFVAYANSSRLVVRYFLIRMVLGYYRVTVWNLFTCLCFRQARLIRLRSRLRKACRTRKLFQAVSSLFSWNGFME